MPVDSNLETYSEEVQDIMGHVPNWIVRWGIIIFFIFILAGIIGSYYFKHSVVISAPFVLTTINPPAPIVCKSSGRISKWYVSNEESIPSGSVIAILENSARYEDIQHINEYLQEINGNWNEVVMMQEFNHKLSLGETQTTYGSFQKACKNLRDYLTHDLVGKKISLLEQRIAMEEKQFELLSLERSIKNEEFAVVENSFKIDSNAYVKRESGIIRIEYEQAYITYLSKKSSKVAFESTIKGAEISMLQLKESLIELRLRRENELSSLYNTLEMEKIALQSQIDNWFENYVLTSPIEGRITLTEFWSENQVVKTGERLATVVPEEESIIVARAFIPASGLGKVSEGQNVKVKLAGFPYMEYGILKGKIHSVSLVPEEQGYIAEINLSEGMKSTYSETLKFVQEMDGTADIITEETRLIYRIFNPLRSLLNN